MFNGKPKYRFYHLPKTGGTSIFNMTRNWENHNRAHPNYNHVKITDYPPNKDEISYAVTRHPYSRFLSAFYHMVDACKDDFYYKNAKVSDCDWLKKKKISMEIFDNDPNKFLAALQEKINPYHKVAQAIFYHFDIFKTQFYWISNSRGNAIDGRINKILHQENLEQEFEKIAYSLGEYPQWPRGKTSNSRLSRKNITLNDQSNAILRSLYRDDFIHFRFSY